MKKYILFISAVLFTTLSVQAQWVQTNGPYGGWIYSIAATNNSIIIGTFPAGIFLSSDQGVTWRKPNQEPLSKYGIPEISCFEADSTRIFAGTDRGIFTSTDGGENWDSVSSPLQYNVYGLGAAGSKLFAAGYDGVFVSTDNGLSWNSAGLSAMDVTSLAVSDSFLAAGTYDNGIYVSTDGGKNWISSYYAKNISCIRMSGSNLYASTNDHLWGSTYIFHILISEDHGKTWNISDNGITGTPNGCAGISSITVCNNNIFAATLGWGIFRSTDNGANWVNVDSGITHPGVLALASNSSMIFAGTGDGFFISADDGISWQHAENGIIRTQIESLFEYNGELFAATWGSGVFHSTDEGNNWEAINKGLENLAPLAITRNNDKLFLGTALGIYTSTDNGSNWNLSGLENHYIDCFAANGSYVFAGASPGGVFVSSDDGVTWDSCNATSSYIQCLAVIDSIVLGGGNGIYRSTDNGLTWTYIDKWFPAYTLINSIVIVCDSVNNNSTDIFAAGDNRGIFHSTDYGASWANTGLEYYEVRSVGAIGSTILAGMYDSGMVYISTNNGNSWEAENSGFITNNPITSFISSSTNIFAGTQGDGVWRRPISELVSVKSSADMKPHGFSLEQNYPNPFNPTTNFEFRIVDFGLVSLKVYDILGNEVAVIVNEELPAGSYKYQWNAAGLASGVYFYQLKSGKFVDTKKLILLR
jgi:photosystem II stability/assembly factor-like uncharacterized protein